MKILVNVPELSGRVSEVLVKMKGSQYCYAAEVLEVDGHPIRPITKEELLEMVDEVFHDGGTWGERQKVLKGIINKLP